MKLTVYQSGCLCGERFYEQDKDYEEVENISDDAIIECLINDGVTYKEADIKEFKNALIYGYEMAWCNAEVYSGNGNGIFTGEYADKTDYADLKEEFHKEIGV